MGGVRLLNARLEIIINMEKKFFSLSKGLRWLIVLAIWALTIAGFVGSSIIKNTNPNYALEIIISTIAILLCVIAICLTIIQLTREEDKKTTDESVDK